MSNFEPIAIVGQGCVVPGCLTIEQLTNTLLHGKVHISKVEDVLVNHDVIAKDLQLAQTNKTFTAIAGSVKGFDTIFRAQDYTLPSELLCSLDPLFLWGLYAAKQACKDIVPKRKKRAGLIMGNLGYPCDKFVELYAQTLLEPISSQTLPKIHPINRFSAGLPARLIAQGLGLEGEAFALNAACASGLYAIKLACDKLQREELDFMVAGAVSCANLFLLNVGFSSLNALSPTGQSRPFHREADGLVPAEGAVFIGLQRLNDAIRDNAPILGVIRAANLSNDGKGGGFLTPSSECQIECIQNAFKSSNLEPSDVSLIECHATGTALGDNAEISSIQKVFSPREPIVIGSVKANLGHLLACAAMTGLLKILVSFHHKVKLQTPNAHPVLPILEDSYFQVLPRNESWNAKKRIACLNSFGFGGNNAHLIVEEWSGQSYKKSAFPKKRDVAVVAVEIKTHLTNNTSQLLEQVVNGWQASDILYREANLPAKGMSFPPNDLRQALGQQLMILELMEKVSRQASLTEKTGVFIGCNIETHSNRYVVRWRLDALIKKTKLNVDVKWLEQVRDHIAPPFQPANVLGAMANIPANRINHRFNCKGAGFTIFAEELSGTKALQIAREAIASGEIESAIVGAADLCRESIHLKIVQKLSLPAEKPADVAVIMVLKTWDQAIKDGDDIIGVMPAKVSSSNKIEHDYLEDKLKPLHNCHAASGLLNTSIAMLLANRGHLQQDTVWEIQNRSPMGIDNIQFRSTIMETGSRSENPEVLNAKEQLLSFALHMPEILFPSFPQQQKSMEAISCQHRIYSKMHMEFLQCQQHNFSAFQKLMIKMQNKLSCFNAPEMTNTKTTKPITTQFLPGPKWERQELEVLASGKVSEIFGRQFEFQDKYDIQVRMPEPPLLLCDRVLGIEGDPLSMGLGKIWTETDVKADSWYLHNGCMPSGIFIEAGQADLLLISWLGIDQHNRGQRAYRLLGCELIFYHGLPQVGDTLSYEIEVYGHAQQGEIRLFFFRYDCYINKQLRISVRNGQAGFFTTEELDSSEGVLWNPQTADYTSKARENLPIVTNYKRFFSKQDLLAYKKGDISACFGVDYNITQVHTRTPTINNNMNFLDEVLEFSPTGGPAKRGYLKATRQLYADDWFFAGHFKNDPCMPGTLMAEACLQAMAFYLTAMGYTLDKDGWRFEPVCEQKYKFICRGQATPQSKNLYYEIFVDEIISDPPTIYAHVLCTVDNCKAFLGERMGVRLITDWPLTSMPHLLTTNIHKVARYQGFAFDYNSLMHAAIGLPSKTFGASLQPYNEKRTPRLPGIPYHFVSRVTTLVADIHQPKAGSSAEFCYDIPYDSWYFDSEMMPYCVLLEIALQPCGWLAAFTLPEKYFEKNLLFRNLDGTATIKHAISQHNQSIVTKVTLLQFSAFDQIILLKFRVLCSIDNKIVYQMDTDFGFFTSQAFEDQKGLPQIPEEVDFLKKESDFVIDVSSGLYNKSDVVLPTGKILMIDHITGFWSDAGKAKLGIVRAIKMVQTTDWFFKAHFFQDPVQPGSLGIEAVLQVLKFYIVHEKLPQKLQNPVCLPIVLDEEICWKYRGQVVPKDNEITILLEVTEIKYEQNSIQVFAQATLWVDNRKIYHIARIGLQLQENKRLRSSSVEKYLADHLHLRSSDIVWENKKCLNLPLNNITIDDAKSEANTVIPQKINWQQVHQYWIKKLQSHGFLNDITSGLVKSFVRYVILQKPHEFLSLRCRPVLFLANHQTAIETVNFVITIGSLLENNTKVIAKEEHRKNWIGMLSEIEKSTQIKLPMEMLFFKREDPQQLATLLDNFADATANTASLFVHVAGTRSHHSGQEVTKISSVFSDLAIKLRWPIVPVKFVGGLPQQGNSKMDFPYNLGQQDYYIGAAIWPEDIEKMDIRGRSQKILTAINSLGPDSQCEEPVLGEIAFTNTKASMITLLQKYLLHVETQSSQTQEVLSYLESIEENLEGTTTMDQLMVIVADYFRTIKTP